jgi:NAD(P)-dependent dehydrogenase (short-subunit alcohol dehydrogenase family)
MNTSLAGKRALVTAGANGIGRAIAVLFAEAGARVHVCDIDLAALASLRSDHPAIGGSLCDVSDAAAVDRLFGEVEAAHGGLDILVNNAGIAGPTSPIEAIDPADWRRTLGVNLDSVFYCTRRGVPLLKAAGGGSIITLSSVAGRLGYPLRTPYSATKFAIVGLTESLAMELGPHGIRVNCIQPGFVAGPRIERVFADKAAARGITPDEQMDEALERVSLRTLVSTDDIANMALFIASDAGRHISGQALSVCGNVEVLG